MIGHSDYRQIIWLLKAFNETEALILVWKLSLGGFYWSGSCIESLNFKLTKSKSGLNRDSAVNVSQIVTLDKTFLTEKVGRLSTKQLNLLDVGLQLVLSV